MAFCVFVNNCRSKHEQHQHKSPPHKRIKVIAYASALPFAALAAAQASNAAATVPASSTAALVAAATGPHLPAILSSAGVLILCCAAAALLLTGIPLLWSLTRATNRMESMMQVGADTHLCRTPQPASVAAAGLFLADLVQQGTRATRTTQPVVCKVAMLVVLIPNHPVPLCCLSLSLCASDLQTLEMELPDTAASIRLSSLELSDCMSELGALGNDISSGVRATAQLVTSAEAGVRQGATLVGAAVVPALARRETRVRGE